MRIPRRRGMPEEESMTPSPAKKKAAAATKAPAKKSATASKAPTKKTAAPAAKAPAKKKAAAATKAPAKKTAAPAAKAPAKKATPATKAPAKKTAAPAAKAPAKKAAAPPATTAAKVVAPPAAPKVSPYASDAKFIAKISGLIAEERAEKAAQREELLAEAAEIIAESGPREVQFDDESGEGSGSAVDREFTLGLAETLLEEIFELDEAARRIKQKRYGICERCHKPIPKMRLEAIPYARLDRDCSNPPVGSRF